MLNYRLLFTMFISIWFAAVVYCNNANRYTMEKASRVCISEKESPLSPPTSTKTAAAKPQRVNVRDEIFECHSVNKSLNAYHHAMLQKVDLDKVPHLALEGIPQMNSSLKKNRDFFMKAIASSVGKVNEIIMKQRQLVLSMREKQRRQIKPTEYECKRFDQICQFYQTKDFSELLLRVAPVPLSLAVAQATLESKFGSNGIIYRYNAYFGLAKTKTSLLKFDNLFNSVIAYTKTINVNRCYREFRKQRALVLEKSQKISGIKLASCIGNYGTDKNYQKLVLKLMRLHGLHTLDKKIEDIPPVKN
jgi:Bax protein